MLGSEEVAGTTEINCLLRACVNQQLAGPREERETERGREKLSWQGDGACQTANGPGWRLLSF